MLTLNISGKTASEALEMVRKSIEQNEGDGDIKISIDGTQFEFLQNFLVSECGFNDVTLEDEDGILYVIASNGQSESQEQQAEQESEKILVVPLEVVDSKPQVKQPEPEPIEIVKNVVIQDSLAVILSYENKKYRPAFMQKFIHALVQSKIKPSIIALLDNAVSLAAYDSKSCEDLKILESLGVSVLISDSCSDRMGLTEALGVGKLSDMSEILEKIFECEKVVSL